MILVGQFGVWGQRAQGYRLTQHDDFQSWRVMLYYQSLNHLIHDSITTLIGIIARHRRPALKALPAIIHDYTQHLSQFK